MEKKANCRFTAPWKLKVPFYCPLFWAKLPLYCPLVKMEVKIGVISRRIRYFFGEWYVHGGD
tara:strand:+ start:359 stop:544 length:186 start_codon:yes stop_codon:yes gene_type:complete